MLNNSIGSSDSKNTAHQVLSGLSAHGLNERNLPYFEGDKEDLTGKLDEAAMYAVSQAKRLSKITSL